MDRCDHATHALGMNDMSKKKSDEVAITLSPLQVEQVMRAAGRNRNGTVSNLLLAALDHAYEQPGRRTAEGQPSPLQKATRAALEDALEDPQLSQSLLRGSGDPRLLRPGPAVAGDHRPGRTAGDVALDDPPLREDAARGGPAGAEPRDAGVPPGGGA